MRVSWERAVSPTPAPSSPAHVQRVSRAALTVVSRGPLRTDGWPSQWMRGAVYDGDGALVENSQRLSISASPVAAADPLDYPGRPYDKLPRLEGTWLYGGHWVQHFGHFNIETLPTLWPEADDRGPVQGLVFHKYLRRSWSVEPWMQRMLDLAGHGGLPVEMVGHRRPLLVDDLLVPSRTVAIRGWARPEAVAVWDRVAARREPAARRTRGPVFLSRTALNAATRADGRPTRTSAQRDAMLDSVFAGCGFDVVTPETLEMDDQLEVAASASVLAGVTGSALHLSAYASSSTPVIEVGDNRSRDRPNPTQLAIDAACGRHHAFLGHATTERQVTRSVRRLLARA